MSLHTAIAHVIAPKGSSGTTVSHSSEPLVASGRLEEWFRQLKTTYIGKAGKQFGRFHDSGSEYPAPLWLQECVDGKMSFMSFSQRFASALVDRLTEDQQVAEGCLLFFEEQLEQGDQVYVFFLQQSEAVYINSDISLESTYYLDERSVTCGAKIQLTPWQAGAASHEAGHYLSVLRTRGEKELNEAFLHTLGFTDKVDTSADTSQFLEVVAAYTQSLPAERAGEFRQKAADYCLEQEKQDKPVALNAISEVINDEQPHAFSQFAQQQSEPPKSEFLVDKNQIRQFVRISGRDEQLSISFSSDCLGESIVYNSDDDQLTITKIPSSLKARLIKHLQS